jgi:PIN domain nuclease of toxin-antitoxin system
MTFSKVVTRLRLLLDTQVLIAAYLGNALPKKVIAAIEDPQNECLLSAMSIAEIAIKSGKGLLPMTDKHVQEAVSDLALTVIPFVVSHAFHLFGLRCITRTHSTEC